jgi:hypothetical protein
MNGTALVLARPVLARSPYSFAHYFALILLLRKGGLFSQKKGSLFSATKESKIVK